MEKLTIGDRFSLVCPEGFRTLTEKERSKLNMLGGGESLCLTNEGNHIVASIAWKEVNAVAGLLLRLISPATSAEANVNRAMTPFGYRKETVLSRQIGGQSAEGFRYTYTAGGTPMVGETYVVRQGRSLVFFHGYIRGDRRDEYLAQWNGLLDAVEPR